MNQELMTIIQETIKETKPNYVSPVMKKVYSSRYTKNETDFKLKNRNGIEEPVHFDIVKSLSSVIGQLQSIRFQRQSTIIIDVSADELNMLVYLLYHGTLFEYFGVITHEILLNVLKVAEKLYANEIIEYIIMILSFLPNDDFNVDE